MNNNSAKNATNLFVTLNKKYTPDAAFFTPSATAIAVASISSDAHFLSSWLKLDTKIFSKGNIKNKADKDTINNTTASDALESDTLDVAAQDAVSNDFNSP